METFLTTRDRLVFKEAGYGKQFELGKRPALLIIDVTYEFSGEKREPILEAIKKVKTACGEEAWDAVDNIQILLQEVRKHSIPIIYTVVDRGSKGGPYAKKNQRAKESATYSSKLYEIVTEVSPMNGEVVITKVAPSAFNGTNLLYQFISQGIDTLIFTGGMTSGCVRASVVDAFTYGFKVALVQEGVFDRGL